MEAPLLCGVSCEPCEVCDICRARRRSKKRAKARARLRDSNRIRKKAKKKKHQVRKLYGKMCYLCKEKEADTIDHVIPICKGGTNDIENLRPACYDCNQKKGSSLIEIGDIPWRNEISDLSV